MERVLQRKPVKSDIDPRESGRTVQPKRVEKITSVKKEHPRAERLEI